MKKIFKVVFIFGCLVANCNKLFARELNFSESCEFNDLKNLQGHNIVKINKIIQEIPVRDKFEDDAEYNSRFYKSMEKKFGKAMPLLCSVGKFEEINTSYYPYRKTLEVSPFSTDGKFGDDFYSDPVFKLDIKKIRSKVTTYSAVNNFGVGGKVKKQKIYIYSIYFNNTDSIKHLKSIDLIINSDLARRVSKNLKFAVKYVIQAPGYHVSISERAPTIDWMYDYTFIKNDLMSYMVSFVVFDGDTGEVFNEFSISQEKDK